jgi:hypothetical protein
MAKKAIEWLKELPDGYRDLALDVRKKKYDDVEFYSNGSAIHALVDWDETPQGADFWGEVRNILYDDKLLPPLSELNHLRRDVAPRAVEEAVKEEMSDSLNKDLKVPFYKVSPLIEKLGFLSTEEYLKYLAEDVKNANDGIIAYYKKENGDWMVAGVINDYSPLYQTVTADVVEQLINGKLFSGKVFSAPALAVDASPTTASRIPHKPTRPAHYGSKESKAADVLHTIALEMEKNNEVIAELESKLKIAKNREKSLIVGSQRVMRIIGKKYPLGVQRKDYIVVVSKDYISIERNVI